MKTPTNQRSPLDQLTDDLANQLVPEGPDLEVKHRLLQTLTHTSNKPATIRPVRS